MITKTSDCYNLNDQMMSWISYESGHKKTFFCFNVKTKARIKSVVNRAADQCLCFSYMYIASD